MTWYCWTFFGIYVASYLVSRAHIRLLQKRIEAAEQAYRDCVDRRIEQFDANAAVVVGLKQELAESNQELAKWQRLHRLAQLDAEVLHDQFKAYDASSVNTIAALKLGLESWQNGWKLRTEADAKTITELQKTIEAMALEAEDDDYDDDCCNDDDCWCNQDEDDE